MNLVDGLEIFRVYWLKGNQPRSVLHRYEVKDPPLSGWSFVLLLRGEKRSTLLCPYTFENYQVSNKSGEMHSMTDHAQAPGVTRVVEMLRKTWAECQGFGWQKDYDLVVKVFRMLGAEVPEQIMRGGEEDTRKRGGKEVKTALARPVKASSKRGKFLKWFMDGGNSRSVREAMAEFGMTRSNALSYLYMLQKDHGIGYELQGDTASLTFPEGCTDPFASQEELDKKAPEPEPEAEDDAPLDDEDDDSWLD